MESPKNTPQLPGVEPVEVGDMHAPVAITAVVSAVDENGKSGQMTIVLPLGVVPSRAQLLDLIAQATAKGNLRQMEKREFVTRMAGGIPFTMTGSPSYTDPAVDIDLQTRRVIQ